MARNKIEDLRNHLFAQLERLSDEKEMKNPIVREREMDRSKAMVEVSKQIIDTAKVEIDFLRAIKEVGPNGMDTSFIPTKDVKPGIGDGGGQA